MEDGTVKCNVMGLIYGAAHSLKRKDRGRAYALAEFANNLRLVMRGEKTMEEFCKVYVGQDGAPLDLDAMFPARKP